MPDISTDIAATIVIGIIAVLGSIGGALLGARVGAKATREATQQAINAQQQAARENDDRQRDAVRLLLNLEIEHNLAILRTLWMDVTREDIPQSVLDDPNPEQQQEMVVEFRADQFIHAAMPVWSRQAWDGLTALLPLAISNEEIERTNRFYGHLESFSVVRSQLVALAEWQPGQEPWFGPGDDLRGIVHPLAFYVNAPKLWSHVEQIVSELMAHGNPIAVVNITVQLAAKSIDDRPQLCKARREWAFITLEDEFGDECNRPPQ